MRRDLFFLVWFLSFPMTLLTLPVSGHVFLVYAQKPQVWHNSPIDPLHEFETAPPEQSSDPLGEFETVRPEEM